MPPVKRDTCPVCSAPEQLLYRLEPTDDSLGLACPECVRSRARTIQRVTTCEAPIAGGVCGLPGAWRNPRTRRNEFFCPTHHAESGDGVIQAPYAARTSAPISASSRPACKIGSDCRGEVKPRTIAGTSYLLCTRHAGKKSAAWAVEDKEV